MQDHKMNRDLQGGARAIFNVRIPAGPWDRNLVHLLGWRTIAATKAFLEREEASAR
jgi:hypothetical protein